MTASGMVLLGTVALEPNRWGTVDRSGASTVAVADWVDAVAAAGFDGLELWERHLTDALVAPPLPIVVLNSYVSFDDADATARDAVAATAARVGATGVKCNVGNDPTQEGPYAERLAAWIDALPPGTAALCECHAGISVAEAPAVAARIFAAAGGPDRMQAIVHTHEAADHLRARFDAYGDRITHVHLNYLDTATMSVPPLADRRADLDEKARLLTQLGFHGSWTIEFVHGIFTDRDAPGPLLDQAIADLAVLRDVLGAVAA